MIFSKKYRFSLSIISGFLLILSFPFTGGLAFLGFVAWVPLLLVENSIRKGKLRSGKVFVHAYLSFLIYNLGTTFWIYFASPEGAYMAIILNSLFMSLAFYAYHLARKHLSTNFGWFFLIVFWVGFEHAHYHWELSWPWLTLGNVFSLYPQVVQWYEITGVMGGSIWLLGVNYLIFSYLLNQIQQSKGNSQRNGKRFLIGIFLALFVPSSFSLVRFFTYKEKSNPVEVAVIQPNIDPYNEKFVRDPSEQINKMLGLAREISSDKTNFILFPETAISSSVDEGFLRQNESVSAFLNFAKDHPNVHLLTGASTYAFFKNKNSTASKKINGSSDFIEFYNSSLSIEKDNTDIVHKSKLVLGVEEIPFTEWFPFLEELSINNGGTSGTLGKEIEPQTINSQHGLYAPIVCYESIYGEFISQQAQKGAELLFIITNDGWWKDTPGYKQHNSFASIRAIETRRSVARAANTGYSSFVNQRGEIIKQSSWWKPDAMKTTLNRNKEKTIYVRWGDFLYRILSALAVLLIVAIIFKQLKCLVQSKKQDKKKSHL